ncbi:MAG: hypothetical protein WAN47_04930 [Nitrosotalea sp.]
MSLSTNPDDKPIPARKDKNPHNYRKVGYSMIIISVSLTIIGLLSWNLASNYHFSTNIMALQEVDTMTPSSGYNIVLFDTSQPVGAKLKMLDHADTFDAAQQLQSQDAVQNPGSTIQVLIFNGSKDYNLNQMAGAEVFIQTPKTGYNVVLDSYNLAVGAKLTSGSYEATLANATAYEQLQTNQIQGQEVKILVFSSSFPDNLKLVTNSSTPVTNYTMVLPPSPVSSAPPTSTNQTTTVASSGSSNATATPSPQVSSNKTTAVLATNQTAAVGANKTASVAATNQTVTVATNKTASVALNQTMAISNTPNATSVVANKISSIPSNQTNATSSKTINATASTKVAMNTTVTTGVSKSVNLNETVSLNVTGK